MRDSDSVPSVKWLPVWENRCWTSRSDFDWSRNILQIGAKTIAKTKQVSEENVNEWLKFISSSLVTQKTLPFGNHNMAWDCLPLNIHQDNIWKEYELWLDPTNTVYCSNGSSRSSSSPGPGSSFLTLLHQFYLMHYPTAHLPCTHLETNQCCPDVHMTITS